MNVPSASAQINKARKRRRKRRAEEKKTETENLHG